MSARPSPARRALLPVVAAVAVLLGAGCSTVGRQPTDYGADYKANFMFGCTGVEPGRQPTLASKSFCECYYKQLVEKVPFDDAKAFEEEQAKADSGKDIVVPKNIQQVIDECRASTNPEPAQ